MKHVCSIRGQQKFEGQILHSHCLSIASSGAKLDMSEHVWTCLKCIPLSFWMCCLEACSSHGGANYKARGRWGFISDSKRHKLTRCQDPEIFRCRKVLIIGTGEMFHKWQWSQGIQVAVQVATYSNRSKDTSRASLMYFYDLLCIIRSIVEDWSGIGLTPERKERQHLISAMLLHPGCM